MLQYGNLRRRFYAFHASSTTRRFCFFLRGCGRIITAAGAGSQHRNHCPFCLSSVHTDVTPGDRAAACGGIMDPVTVWVRRNGGWALNHRFRTCGAFHSNCIAAADNKALPLSIAVRPLAQPSFPLHCLDKMLQS